MKNILVPTDFSKNAENAFLYAIEIAKKENAKLILLHTYDINYTNAYVPLNLILEEFETLKKDSKRGLDELCYKIVQIGNINYEAISRKGETVETIINVIKEKDIDMVIMGTKGASGLAGAIFGTNTAKVIEKVKCPVIAVPSGVVPEPIKKITYATSYESNDIDGLKKAVELAEVFNAQVNVLHISDYTDSPEMEKMEMKKFMNDVNKKIHYNNMSFQLLNGSSVELVLDKYISDNSTSMLVMSTHHRDFFDRIFGRSLTRQMAYHTKVPLMALHYSKKPELVMA